MDSVHVCGWPVALRDLRWPTGQRGAARAEQRARRGSLAEEGEGADRWVRSGSGLGESVRVGRSGRSSAAGESGWAGAWRKREVGSRAARGERAEGKRSWAADRLGQEVRKGSRLGPGRGELGWLGWVISGFGSSFLFPFSICYFNLTQTNQSI
jgi:hypothetical protein